MIFHIAIHYVITLPTKQCYICFRTPFSHSGFSGNSMYNNLEFCLISVFFLQGYLNMDFFDQEKFMYLEPDVVMDEGFHLSQAGNSGDQIVTDGSSQKLDLTQLTSL